MSAPAMKVWTKRLLSAWPNTSRLPGRWVVWMLTGVGKERSSATLSEMPVRSRNQSLVPRIGRSPLMTFWL